MSLIPRKRICLKIILFERHNEQSHVVLKIKDSWSWFPEKAIESLILVQEESQKYLWPQTTDARWGNPLPNYYPMCSECEVDTRIVLFLNDEFLEGNKYGEKSESIKNDTRWMDKTADKPTLS